MKRKWRCPSGIEYLNCSFLVLNVLPMPGSIEEDSLVDIVDEFDNEDEDEDMPVQEPEILPVPRLIETNELQDGTIWLWLDS